MKLRDVGYLLGLRPKARRYGYEVRAHELPREGTLEFAQWLHPLQAETPPTQEVIDELRTFLSPGDFAIDVGASLGDTAVPMAWVVGPSGCVLALEPNEFVFPVLDANSRLNRGRINLVPRMVAAGQEEGELEFEYSDPGFCNGGKLEDVGPWTHGHAFKLPVQAVRLDDILRRDFSARLPRWRYLKTDAEGYDLSVLETLRPLIAEHRPHIKSEVYKHANSEKRRAMMRFFLDLGYELHRVINDAELRGERVSLGDADRWRHYDLFCIP
jgi:FkbM family methyltransferase